MTRERRLLGGVKKNLAAKLMFEPVAAVILRTCLLESDVTARAPVAIQKRVKSTWAKNNFPPVAETEFNEAVEFLKSHQLIKVVEHSPDACEITELGTEVGKTVWAAYLAFLKAP